MKEGKLPAEDGSTPDGQNLVVPLLERCLKWCDIVQEKYAFTSLKVEYLG